MERKIRIIDKRIKEKYLMDDGYLNGYAFPAPPPPSPPPSCGAGPAPATAALPRAPLGSEALRRAAAARGGRGKRRGRGAVGGGGRPGGRSEKGRVDFLYLSYGKGNSFPIMGELDVMADGAGYLYTHTEPDGERLTVLMLESDGLLEAEYSMVQKRSTITYRLSYLKSIQQKSRM